MLRRVIALSIGIAALSCGISASAFGSEATFPAGTRASTSFPLTLTGKNIRQVFSIFGEASCHHLTLNAKMTTNNGSTVEASGENNHPAQFECGEGPYEMFTSFKITQLVTSESGKGTMTFEAAEDIGNLKCPVTGTAVPFTYTPKTSTIKFDRAPEKSRGCGNGTFSGEFLLEKTGGTMPVILD